MATRDGSDKIYGPTKHRARWRVVIVYADGRREYVREGDEGPAGFATEEGARDFIRGWRAAAEQRTVASAAAEYLAHRKAIGMKGVTTDGHRLRGLLRYHKCDRPLRGLTPAVAAQLVAERKAKVAFDTIFGELCVARQFTGWCIKKGWIASDPFAVIEPEGQKARGKEQLRIDESRRFLHAALAEGTKEGLAAAMALLMGMRATEITAKRSVRDVDDSGRVIWIDRAKTERGNRHLEVPAVLRPRLIALCAGRTSTEPLFGVNHEGKPRDRHWLLYHVKRLCRKVGVPEVTTHGLRGTHSSIAVEAVSVEHVAASLGQHPSGAVTRRHYLAPGAEQRARSRRAADLLKD